MTGAALAPRDSAAPGAPALGAAAERFARTTLRTYLSVGQRFADSSPS